MIFIRILLANPRGFCAGVDRAVNIVYRLIKLYGSPIYIRHEIVHNRYVVENFHRMGVIFVDNIHDVPYGSILVFSAHGVSKSLRIEAKNRNLIVFDATCPLVLKVHMEVCHASRIGREVILIGHSGHPEVEGTLGQYSNISGGIYLVESEQDVCLLSVKNPNNLTFVTQTTLSVRDTACIIHKLRSRFPFIHGPKKSDICYATYNRQEAVCNLVNQVDLVIIVGSRNSSNSNRLVELVMSFGKLVYFVDSVDDIQESWISNLDVVGISAGASVPNVLVDQIILKLKFLSNNTATVEELLGYTENIVFKMPRGLS